MPTRTNIFARGKPDSAIAEAHRIALAALQGGPRPTSEIAALMPADVGAKATDPQARRLVLAQRVLRELCDSGEVTRCGYAMWALAGSVFERSERA